MIEITSPSNEKFKFFKSLLTKKGRDEWGKYIVEGIKSVNDAISAKCHIDAVILREDMKSFQVPAGIMVYCMPASLADKLSDTKSPQGVYAIINKYEAKKFSPKPNGAYVYCDRISDPGNLGTIIRTADGAGFDGVILSPDCVEAYNPKTIRSTMGSFFHIDVIENQGPQVVAEFVNSGGKVFGGILTGDTKDYRSVDYSGSIMIAVGNEASGISDEVKKLCCPVKIKIVGQAESLNAGVAAALLMYEACYYRLDILAQTVQKQD